MNKKENQRTRLTKKLLQDALLDLMQKKPVEKITIKEICEKAELNRSTFYLYYSEPNDLLKKIEDDIIDKTAAYLKNISDAINHSAMRYICSFLDYIRENDSSFRTLLVKQDDLFFRRKFVALSLEQIIAQINCTVDRKIEKYVYNYLLNGSLSLIICWIEQDYDLTPQELAALLFRMAKGALEPFAAE